MTDSDWCHDESVLSRWFHRAVTAAKVLAVLAAYALAVRYLDVACGMAAAVIVGAVCWWRK